MVRLSRWSSWFMGVTLSGVGALSLASTVSPAEVDDLRLVPVELIGMELGGSVANSALDAVVGRTQGFSLSAQPSGALRLEARGEPFQSVLGRESSSFEFDAVSKGWQARTDAGTVQIQLNAQFQDPQSSKAIAWSGMTLCRTATQRCSYFFLAKAEQVCKLMTTGNFAAQPALRQQALQALNAINSQGIACTGS